MKDTSLAVCIATYERPALLESTLEALAVQTRLPDEIVISDASSSAITQESVCAFRDKHPNIGVKYVKSERRALPWQRWWAFTHSESESILFLDDDVRLLPEALETLLDVYRSLFEQTEGESVAGVGFTLGFGNDALRIRDSSTFKERWLGTSCQRSGTITPGGLTVSLAGIADAELVPVDYLSGGAMSFRREILKRISRLDALIRLYEKGIGRGEDGVLSSYARRQGQLYLIPRIHAIHPPVEEKQKTPYAMDGWRRGVTETWTRAHILRWLATDAAAYREAWLRSIILELARSTVALARGPWHGVRWARLLGDGWGIAMTLFHWKKIPDKAYSGMIE